jgi:WD40 repeat protein
MSSATKRSSSSSGISVSRLSASVWNLDDPKRQRLEVRGRVASATLSHNRARALLCELRDDAQITVRIWDLERGQPMSPPMQHDTSRDSTIIVGRKESQAVFDREQARVLSWCKDCTARLWDARTGTPLVPPMRHKAQIWGRTLHCGRLSNPYLEPRWYRTVVAQQVGSRAWSHHATREER